MVIDVLPYLTGHGAIVAIRVASIIVGVIIPMIGPIRGGQNGVLITKNQSLTLRLQATIKDSSQSITTIEGITADRRQRIRQRYGSQIAAQRERPRVDGHHRSAVNGGGDLQLGQGGVHRSHHGRRAIHHTIGELLAGHQRTTNVATHYRIGTYRLNAATTDTHIIGDDVIVGGARLTNAITRRHSQNTIFNRTIG